MDYPLETSETAGHAVIVRMAGIFSEPQLLVDGSSLAATDGKFVLPFTKKTEGETPESETTEVCLKTPMLDFVPIVEIDGRRVEIAPPLPSWAYLWCLIPTILLLVFGLGVLPALAGLALSYVGLYQLRAAPPDKRYVWSGVFNVATIVLVIVLRLLHHHHVVPLHHH